MGRRKIDIERINDDRKRQTTFKKRKDGLLKKAMQLSILCDVEIGIFMFTKTTSNQTRLYEYTSLPDPSSTLSHIANFEGPVDTKTNDTFHDKVDPHLQFIAAHQPNFPKRHAAYQAAVATAANRQPAFVAPGRVPGHANYLPMTEGQQIQMKALQEERRRVNAMHVDEEEEEGEEVESDEEEEEEEEEEEDGSENTSTVNERRRRKNGMKSVGANTSLVSMQHESRPFLPPVPHHLHQFQQQQHQYQVQLQHQYQQQQQQQMQQQQQVKEEQQQQHTFDQTFPPIEMPALDGLLPSPRDFPLSLSPVTPTPKPALTLNPTTTTTKTPQPQTQTQSQASTLPSSPSSASRKRQSPQPQPQPQQQPMKKLKILIPEPSTTQSNSQHTCRFSLFRAPVSAHTPIFPGPFPFMSPRTLFAGTDDPLQTPRNPLGLPSPSSAAPLLTTPHDNAQ